MTGIIGNFFTGAFIIFGILNVQAQDKPKNSLFLSGIVMDAQEQKELPFVNVRVKNTFYGTATDTSGYFSLFVNPGDTLLFSYVGYQDASFIMPYGLETDQYFLLQLLRKDTLLLEEVVVFPWPDYDDFIEAFLDTEPPKDMTDLVIEVKRDLNETVQEAQLSEYYLNQQRYQRLFLMHNIFPQHNLLDPERWADFIRDLRTEDVEKEPSKY